MAAAEVRRPAVGILSISAVAEDHTALRQLLRGLSCRVAAAGSCQTAFQQLSRGQISIVVCERDLPDGTWLDILKHMDGSIETPFLIVTSRLADETLWAEVLNLGGFDVIAKPFDPRDARHVLETACLRRRSQSAANAGRQLAAAYAA